MIAFLWIIGTFLAFCALEETACRVYHRHRFGVPFHARVMGEYPYKSFVERVAPPLHYRFRKGFRSPMVNINRFRCRGEEPAGDGVKRRIVVIGESNYFGAKLPREGDLWSCRLARLLAQHGYTNWEVINAGNPMYNSVQHRALWEAELRTARPDILLINLGGNDVTQAWMMGSQWKPGAPWPWKFIQALERKTPWWNKLLSRFCFYLLLRRRMSARRPFVPRDNTLQWDACLQSIRDSIAAMEADARAMGAKVACISFAIANDPEPKPEDRKKLDAIQVNWESFSKGNIHYIYGMRDFLREKICPELGIPFLDLQEVFRAHPRRYELFLDLAHWNARGMRVVGDFIFREAARRGWLNGKEPWYE